jgi:hypothetical protein
MFCCVVSRLIMVDLSKAAALETWVWEEQKLSEAVAFIL